MYLLMNNQDIIQMQFSKPWQNYHVGSHELYRQFASNKVTLGAKNMIVFNI